MHGGLKRVFGYFASTELAVALFLAISLVAIPGTFLEERTIYASPFFRSLLWAFGLNLIFCTVRRFKSLSRAVLVLHGGVILTLFGCVLTSFGYVATVNVYEGTTVDQVYRWDLEKDTPLGVDLAVKKINREFYPVPIKIGVLKGDEKHSLHTLKSGESFDLNSYRIKAGSLEFPSENIKLSVFDKDRLVGSYNTDSGSTDLPAGFPFAFKLVAFQNPVMKRLWVDLSLRKDSESFSEGVSEVNHPFQWGGLSFYNTQVATDPSGMPYAGIQIVRDPGRPYVFAGFVLMCVGAVLSFYRRAFKKINVRPKGTGSAGACPPIC